MAATNTTTELPYSVRRILGKYEPTFRARLTYYLKQRAKEKQDVQALTWDDVTGAISQVFGELTSGPPKFSDEREQAAMEDFRAGRCKTTKEWADELRSDLA